MKRSFLFFGSGLKTAILSFAISVSVMSLSIFILSGAVGEIAENPSEKSFFPTGYEPYKDMELSLAAMGEPGEKDSERLPEELLAAAIEASAPGESYAVRVAFGAVLMNRVDNPGFPSTLASVLRCSGLYPEVEKEISERSMHAARDALLGVDPTLGALYVMRTDDPAYEEYSERITAIYGSYAFIK